MLDCEFILIESLYKESIYLLLNIESFPLRIFMTNLCLLNSVDSQKILVTKLWILCRILPWMANDPLSTQNITIAWLFKFGLICNKGKRVKISLNKMIYFFILFWKFLMSTLVYVGMVVLSIPFGCQMSHIISDAHNIFQYSPKLRGPRCNWWGT